MSKAEELLREVQELLKQASPPVEEGAPPSRGRVLDPEADEAPVVLPDVHEEPGPAPAPVVAPSRRPRRSERHRRLPPPRRTGRVVLVMLLVLGLVAAGIGAALLLSQRRETRRAGEPGTGPLPAQSVVAWTVWQDRPSMAFVTVMGAAEGLEPVMVGIPGHTIVNIAGQGPGTLEEAAARGDAELVATTVSSLLHVQIDAALSTPLAGVGRLVDRVGGIGVDETRMRGASVVAYLTQRPVDAELRFLRWQEVVGALVPALASRPAVLRDAIPPRARAVIAAVGAEAAAPLELPVREIGSGLAKPVRDEVDALVREWFVPTATTAAPVDLVVLNGNGIPGIGARVAQLLVPAGFRLVSSQNAPTFDVKVTQIVATDETYLDEAELAKELLGVGRVALDPQTTVVADVAIVVGKDFRRA